MFVLVEGNGFLVLIVGVRVCMIWKFGIFVWSEVCEWVGIGMVCWVGL